MPSTQQSFNLESIKNPDLTLEKLKNLLRQDQALKTVYAEHTYDIKDPDSPDSVLEICFSNMCGDFTSRLVEYLRTQGIKSVEATSASPAGDTHVYAVLFAGPELVILDPSSGQYIKGYRDIFIGSRSELRSLIMSEATELHYSEKDRAHFFQRLWGDNSMVAYSPSKNALIRNN
jgi:hypothetical protein